MGWGTLPAEKAPDCPAMPFPQARSSQFNSTLPRKRAKKQRNRKKFDILFYIFVVLNERIMKTIKVRRVIELLERDGNK